MDPDFDGMNLLTPQQDLDVLEWLAEKAVMTWRKDSEPPAEAVEIGTWAGRTALILANHFNRVYCVDHWQGSPHDRTHDLAREQGTPEQLFEIFCRNMGPRLYRTVFPCRGSSELYARVWPHKVALVWIDGDHSRDGCLSDIRAWLPHVAPGGILCGHDFNEYFPGVPKAVRETFAEGDYHTRASVWWVQVGHGKP